VRQVNPAFYTSLQSSPEKKKKKIQDNLKDVKSKVLGGFKKKLLHCKKDNQYQHNTTQSDCIS